ncbi:MAG: hypothetical protein FJZ47_15860 [Candidatus Tectomicrobia bacterium]|uniref:Uncharacterized protein n=1 Tax=Tectimicrobiota bacterium TaxID=2528274 RepID=A0A937W3V3_UNCTE|nr:hypothetical protein [Candidatus Tectomicrobia bacterium]
MQEHLKYARRTVVMLSLVIGLTLTGIHTVAWGDSQARAKVVPRDANVYGSSYSEWSARWLQWLFSTPTDTNPAADTTGANCAEGQSGPVWFLAGSFGTTVTRECTVPAGKALFFPLVNGIFGAGVFDCEPTVPGTACNLAALRSAAAASMDAVTLEASVDGRPLRDLLEQRVQSPVMTFTYPPSNVFGVPPGTYAPNVADGYWLMLAPLRVGTHTLHFKAEITGGPFVGTVIEVTYHLTIAP